MMTDQQSLPENSVLIIGTGALASLFAARIAPHAPVTMIGSWPDGLSALESQGVVLVDEGVEQTHTVRVLSDPEQCVGVEQALVLVKSWQSERAGSILATCLSKEGVALTLQNGLGNLDVLEQYVSRDQLAQGVTTGGATLLAPGTVRVAGAGAVHLEQHPRLNKIRELLSRSGFMVSEAEDLTSLIWGKLVINASINPITALLAVPNGELLERFDAAMLLKAVALETAAVAEAAGIQLPYDDPAAAAESVARDTSANISSMLQDVRRGAPTEIDAINGAIVQEAGRLGLTAPLNLAFWRLVRARVDPAGTIAG